MGLAVVAEPGVDAGQIDRHGARPTVTSRPFRVGGSGKPVRIRRGPATVTGDAAASGIRAAATVRTRGPGRREGSSPGARRPASDRASRGPRGKGLAHAEDAHRRARRLGWRLALLAAAPRARRPNVTVRVEGAAARSCRARAVTTATEHAARTATAHLLRNQRGRALDVATAGDWGGTCVDRRRCWSRRSRARPHAPSTGAGILGVLGQLRIPPRPACAVDVQEGDEVARSSRPQFGQAPRPPTAAVASACFRCLAQAFGVPVAAVRGGFDGFSLDQRPRSAARR